MEALYYRGPLTVHYFSDGASVRAIVRRLNKTALDRAVYAPLGFYLMHYAWRKNVAGIVPGPLPFFWGVSKTA
jgi:peptide/nickel transport system substrate-binding protein